MSKEIINTGLSAGDGTGDTLRAGMIKANSNFDEIYSRVISPVLANTVYCGPQTGSASIPDFRKIVGADIATNTVTGSNLLDATITLSKLAIEVANFLIPTGTIVSYGGSSSPSNWLLCNGTAVSRTTYSALYAIIGTTYGTGDGSTTFNLPDLRGRVPVGVDGGAGRVTSSNTLGATQGSEKHTLTIDEMPAHTHTTDRHFAFGVGTGPNNVNAQTAGDTGSTGGGQPHNNMQPSLITNYIIKV